MVLDMHNSARRMGQLQQPACVCNVYVLRVVPSSHLHRDWSSNFIHMRAPRTQLYSVSSSSVGFRFCFQYARTTTTTTTIKQVGYRAQLDPVEHRMIRCLCNVQCAFIYVDCRPICHETLFSTIEIITEIMPRNSNQRVSLFPKKTISLLIVFLSICLFCFCSQPNCSSFQFEFFSFQFE